MNRCPIETIALLAQPLPHDVNGNPRHFISVVDIPVTPGSKLARKVGLRMFRGKSRGPGFVIQSHHLETSLREVFAALDQHAPQGAPHAVRSDGPLFFVLRLPDEQYRYLTETFQALAPHLIETTEIFGKIIIPSGLPSPDCDAAVNMLMSFPVLRTATLKQLFHQWVSQYYGLEIVIRRCEDSVNEISDLTDPVRDREVISSFLAREEPPAR